jgi:hypothetical protein
MGNYLINKKGIDNSITIFDLGIDKDENCTTVLSFKIASEELSQLINY